jgi:hypothetical protein
VGINLTRVGHIFLSFLGSVYLGKDIRTGAEVALKIGHADHLPSRIGHEYNVYQKTAGSTGISPVLWYGKEGPFEVIVLDHLGTSLGDLVNAQQLDLMQTFFFASQMVCSSDVYGVLLSLFYSCRQLNRYIFDTTSIVTSSPATSWFDPINQPSSSLTLAWRSYSAILQLIYTHHTLRIIRWSVLFRLCPSLASKDMLSHVAMT